MPPCPAPVVDSLPFEPPLHLCREHLNLIADELYERMERQINQMGWIVG